MMKPAWRYFKLMEPTPGINAMKFLKPISLFKELLARRFEIPPIASTARAAGAEIQ